MGPGGPADKWTATIENKTGELYLAVDGAGWKEYTSRPVKPQPTAQLVSPVAVRQGR